MEFPALVLDNSRKIRHKTSDGYYEYRLKQHLKPGFYIFETFKMTARMIREAEPEEREVVMKDKPVINALTSMHNDKQWFCHPLNKNQIDKHKKLRFPAPLFFTPEELSIFQAVQAWVVRAYGRQVLIFKDFHLRYPTLRLDALRGVIDTTDPVVFIPGGRVTKPTREEMEAFEFAKKSTKPAIERLIEESLHFVEAKLIKYADQGNGQYRVDYEYKGEQDWLVVNQRLTVVEAGFCLTNKQGEHYAGHVNYDLGSMVLVKHRGKHRWD